MTTPKVAKDLFAEAQAVFTPVVGAPNNDDAKRLNEAFINALQQGTKFVKGKVYVWVGVGVGGSVGWGVDRCIGTGVGSDYGIKFGIDDGVAHCATRALDTRTSSL